MSENKLKLGDAIFASIERNAYLGELYVKLLKSYGMKIYNLNQNQQPFTHKEKIDILRFADLLSKSNDPNNSYKHKIWAQEIVILMGELYEDDPAVRIYAGNVYSSVGNHKGIEHINPSHLEVSVLEQIFAEYRSDLLTSQTTSSATPLRPLWESPLLWGCSSRMKSCTEQRRTTP